MLIPSHSNGQTGSVGSGTPSHLHFNHLTLNLVTQEAQTWHRMTYRSGLTEAA